MIITKADNYTHIKPTQKKVKDFIKKFENHYKKLIGEHLIIDFSEKININIEELVLFLKLSVQHKENGTSFVLICKGINIDELPSELNVVPTLTEGIDILEMDAIERDLGF